MAISLVSTTTYSANKTTTITSQTCPFTAIAGDVVIVTYVAANQYSGAWPGAQSVTSSGWTLANPYTKSWYKVMGSTPNSSVVVRETGWPGFPGYIVITVWRGVSNSQPLGYPLSGQSHWSTPSSGGSITSTTVNIAIPNSAVYLFTYGTNDPWNWPSGHTGAITQSGTQLSGYVADNTNYGQGSNQLNLAFSSGYVLAENVGSFTPSSLSTIGQYGGQSTALILQPANDGPSLAQGISLVSSTISTPPTGVTYYTEACPISGAAAGDLVIVSYVNSGDETRYAAPSAMMLSDVGWALAHGVNHGTGNSPVVSVWYKVMGATPDTAVHASETGGVNFPGQISITVWRGVDPLTPFDVDINSVMNFGVKAVYFPVIAPATPGAVIYALAAGNCNTPTWCWFLQQGTELSNFTSTQTSSVSPQRNVQIASGKIAWIGGELMPVYLPTIGLGSYESINAVGITMALRPLIPRVVTSQVQSSSGSFGRAANTTVEPSQAQSSSGSTGRSLGSNGTGSQSQSATIESGFEKRLTGVSSQVQSVVSATGRVVTGVSSQVQSAVSATGRVVDGIVASSQAQVVAVATERSLGSNGTGSQSQSASIPAVVTRDGPSASSQLQSAAITAIRGYSILVEASQVQSASSETSRTLASDSSASSQGQGALAGADLSLDSINSSSQAQSAWADTQWVVPSTLESGNVQSASAESAREVSATSVSSQLQSTVCATANTVSCSEVSSQIQESSAGGVGLAVSCAWASSQVQTPATATLRIQSGLNSFVFNAAVVNGTSARRISFSGASSQAQSLAAVELLLVTVESSQVQSSIVDILGDTLGQNASSQAQQSLATAARGLAGTFASSQSQGASGIATRSKAFTTEGNEAQSAFGTATRVVEGSIASSQIQRSSVTGERTVSATQTSAQVQSALQEITLDLELSATTAQGQSSLSEFVGTVSFASSSEQSQEPHLAAARDVDFALNSSSVQSPVIGAALDVSCASESSQVQAALAACTEALSGITGESSQVQESAATATTGSFAIASSAQVQGASGDTALDLSAASNSAQVNEAAIETGLDLSCTVVSGQTQSVEVVGVDSVGFDWASSQARQSTEIVAARTVTATISSSQSQDSSGDTQRDLSASGSAEQVQLPEGATDRSIGSAASTQQLQSAEVQGVRTRLFTSASEQAQGVSVQVPGRSLAAGFSSEQTQESTGSTTRSFSGSWTSEQVQDAFLEAVVAVTYVTIQTGQVESCEAQFMREVTAFSHSTQVQESDWAFVAFPNDPSVYIAYVAVDNFTAYVGDGSTQGAVVVIDPNSTSVVINPVSVMVPS